MVAPRSLLLTGSVGAGKTTVLLELGRLLDERGDPYALIDLDWLCWVKPGEASGVSVHDVLVANLRAVRPNLVAAGVTHAVLARHLRCEAELATIREAVGGELSVVRLDAPAEVLERRLRARDEGAELSEHLAEAASAVALDGPAVSSGDRPVREIALDVLAAAGW